jgi:hypothetical protein
MTTGNTWMQAPGKTGTFVTTLVLQPENAGGFVLIDTSVGTLTDAVLDGQAAALECVIDITQMPDPSGVMLYVKNEFTFESTPSKSAPLFTVGLRVFPGGEVQGRVLMPFNACAQIMKWNVEYGAIYVFGGSAMYYASGP